MTPAKLLEIILGLSFWKVWGDQLLYTWNPNDLYFWRSTTKTGLFQSKQGSFGVPGVCIQIYIGSIPHPVTMANKGLVRDSRIPGPNFNVMSSWWWLASWVRDRSKIYNTLVLLKMSCWPIIFFKDIFWVVPPPSNSHHQDNYIFSRGSQPKPSFATVTGRGDNPRYICKDSLTEK